MSENRKAQYHGINHGRSGQKERIYCVINIEKCVATNWKTWLTDLLIKTCLFTENLKF
jgi:hypothetical protein